MDGKVERNFSFFPNEINLPRKHQDVILKKLKIIATLTTTIESRKKFSPWLINVETIMTAIITALGLINWNIRMLKNLAGFFISFFSDLLVVAIL